MDMLIDKKNLATVKFAATPTAAERPLNDGEISVSIDKFALTANNLTYAVFGDAMNYWKFFPGPEGFGRVPVWGFGTVVKSRHPGISEGTRYYGYFPVAASVVMKPDHVNAHGFTDVMPARQGGAHAFYNNYVLTSADPSYDRAHEEYQALFRPLFTTSFLIADWLSSNTYFGASAVILSSASSKTSWCTAALLHPRKDVEMVGLTSEGNTRFVQDLDVYDRDIAYGHEAMLHPIPSIFVDMAGNAAVREAVHKTLGKNLVKSVVVGGTHWTKSGPAANLPGPQPEFFFAPSHVETRIRDWGAAGFHARLGEAWHRVLPKIQTQVHVRTGHGEKDVARVWGDLISGKVNPADGHILSL